MQSIHPIIIASFILAFALPVGEANAACVANQQSFADVSSDKRNTVQGPQSVEELEKAFGYSNKEWNELKATILPDDRIYFVTHGNGERFLASYYILVRGGCVISTLLVAIG